MHRGLTLALLLTIFAAPAVAQAPASPSTRTASTDAPALGVRVVGTGTPVILIPGLASGGAVWDALVARLAARHECHVITLPGFAGQPAVAADSTWLPRMRDAVIAYARARRLARPVLIGHSLGGFLALDIAATAPSLPRAVINIDGLPFLPASMGPQMTIEMVRPMADQMRQAMRTPSAANAQMLESQMRTMVRDTTHLPLLRTMASTSDAATVAESMHALYVTDLRPRLSLVTAPVLNLHAWVAYRAFGQTRAGMEQLVAGQYGTLRTATTRISDTAHHFIMLDEPQWVLSEIEGLLARAP